MSRKLRFTFIAFLAALNTASAVGIAQFTSWDKLTQESPDIIIARCTSTPNPTRVTDGMIWSEIEVVTVLKGATKAGAAKMVSQYWPHQGEQFLMFSAYQNNEYYRGYNATETYRIVPMEGHFEMSDLTGKPLAEQIRLILSRRLNDVRKELELGAKEKERLEQGVKK